VFSGIKYVWWFPFHFFVNRITFKHMLVFCFWQIEVVRALSAPDENENIMGTEVSQSNQSEMDGKDVLNLVLSPPVNAAQVKRADWKVGELVLRDASPEEIEASWEVNMEACITTDDVMRAGGFGARDDISSFLPVASDSTDFEATIRDARDYEEPQGDICRQGLGWTEATEAE
jgi:hypothetical protein